MISPSSRPRRRLATWTYIRDGRAAVEEYQDQYDLNEAGTHVWLAADGSRTVAEIAASLADRFDAPADACAADVAAFVEELSEAGLVDVLAAD